MDWFEQAKKDYIPGEFGYRKISNKYNLSVKTVESRFAREKKRNGIEINKEVNIKDGILQDISKECAITYLCDKYKISERVLHATLEDIKEEGYQVTELNSKVKLCKDIVKTENKHTEKWQGEKIIKFGVVSDCHLGSKWQQLTFLNYLYDVFAREEITTVYNSGDLTDGYHMHPGHEYEVFKHGADEQEQYVIDVYPYRQGITTKFITGNHDHSHIKSGGHDIGKPIAAARPDMIYLGLSNAKVNITPNCVVELNHPLDGASYALSYAPQKTIDAIEGGEKPNILLNGHHHKAFYMMYRNIHAYEAATTCAQTPWMRGKRIAANMGGWIIEVSVDENGTIKRCKGELIPLYKPLLNDYRR